MLYLSLYYMITYFRHEAFIIPGSFHLHNHSSTCVSHYVECHLPTHRTVLWIFTIKEQISVTLVSFTKYVMSLNDISRT